MEKSSITSAMNELSDIKSVIDLWPTRDALREAMKPHLHGRPITTDRIHKWAKAGSIPSVYMHAVICAAIDCKISLDAATLVRLNSLAGSAAA